MHVRALPSLLLPFVALLALAPVQARTGRLVRDYRFAGNLKDAKGGPALRPLGGTVGNRVYTFEAGQGLLLRKAGVKDHYAIELTFQVAEVNSYVKLVDLKKRASDTGLYVRSGGIVFYNRTQPAGTVTAGEPVRVLLERDRRSRQVRGWVNQQLAFEFTDTEAEAVVDGTQLFFFKDDTQTSDEESGGAVTRIRIFSGPVSGG